MKLTAIILLGFTLQLSAKAVSQTITYSAKQVALTEVFSVIKKQTGYVVFYDRNWIEMARPVSISANNQPLESFLREVLNGLPLDFVVEKKAVVITRKGESTNVDLKAIAKVLAPPGNVQGRITNENGEPLAGANVSVRGTDLIGVADDKGYYIIGNVTAGNYTLIVTYVGYKNIIKDVKLTDGKTTSINFELEVNPYGFNDIIVSANLVASKKREIASAVTTITAKQIEQLSISNITELFRGEVPGGNSWNNGPGTTNNLIKLRGDISFSGGESTVKVFIDGIEVADATKLSTIILSSIDHIEVLHGPQASTLYGSGATSGVIYIFTKKGKIGGPHIDAKISAGTIASKWVSKTAYQQDHSLNVSGGSEGISYNLGGSYFHYDPFWPDGNNTNTAGFGSLKAKQGKFTAELTGQFSNINYRTPLNPLLRDSFPTLPSFTNPFNTSLKQTEQTLGLNIIYNPFTWWQHNLALGIDQSNSILNQYLPRNAFPSDTLNFKNNNNQNKRSYRYYTTLRIPISNFLQSTITAGLDHYVYESSSLGLNGLGVDPDFSPVGDPTIGFQKYSNTGYYAQGVFGFYNKFFLTAGVRSESTNSFGKSSGASVAPRVGASFVVDLGDVMVKPRMSYGKSIKVPDPIQFVDRIVAETPYFALHQLANPDLKPQEQVGYDIGFDAEFGKGRGTLEATYYNQDVNNFFSNSYDYTDYPPLIVYKWINVGKVKNTGLELAGTLNLHPIKFRFTYSVTNSKVASISNTGYEGYYQNGDRISGIPKSSGGATISYSFPSLFKSSPGSSGSIILGATYFGGWVNQDQIAQYKDYYINFDYSKTQRDYVINYSGYALFRLGINYNINKNVEVFLNVNNLFNSQQFESLNIIPTQGRLTMLGLRINY